MVIRKLKGPRLIVCVSACDEGGSTPHEADPAGGACAGSSGGPAHCTTDNQARRVIDCRTPRGSEPNGDATPGLEPPDRPDARCKRPDVGYCRPSQSSTRRPGTLR